MLSMLCIKYHSLMLILITSMEWKLVWYVRIIRRWFFFYVVPEKYNITGSERRQYIALESDDECAENKGELFDLNVIFWICLPTKHLISSINSNNQNILKTDF